MNQMREAISQAAVAPLQVSSGGGRQQYRFGKNFAGFSGHFPDYPVLPAVLQSLLGQILAEQIVGRPLRFQALQQAKFTRQVRPDELLDVTVECQQQDGMYRCKAILTVADERAAQFVLLLEERST
ncbi:MAG TPA: hypothetical protein VKN62_07790 [Pelovirga sp.]|nr:hypothetical protein [Pelovirga sp.]